MYLYYAKISFVNVMSLMYKYGFFSSKMVAIMEIDIVLQNGAFFKDGFG